MKALDFEGDIKSEIRDFCNHWDFRISFKQPFEKILLDYLTVRFKIIEPRKRAIYLSPGLMAELKSHSKKDEIIGIIHQAGKGDNLNCFLSKKVLQSNFHDHLQNEWNIFHFHLSLEKPPNSYFVKQVDSLLFAYITKNDIIFLGTEKHKDGIFGNIKWLEILHDHFAEKISEFKDSIITEVLPKVNASQRQNLWNKGLTLGMTKVRDTVYHSPGIGRATSGHGMLVTKSHITVLRWIYEIRNQLTTFENEVCKTLNILPQNAEFKMIFGDVTIELIETNSRKVVVCYPQILDVKR